jgi:transposase-like protein
VATGKYQEWLQAENLILIEGWARDGLTDEQIAHNIGIATSTLYEWKKQYAEISEALKRGKAVVDRMVENALLKRALGYEYKEVREKFEKGICTERTVTKKEVIPDTTAQIFWLKNRKPDEWRDKRFVEDSIEFEDDGFMKALKEGTAEIFAKAGDAIET